MPIRHDGAGARRANCRHHSAPEHGGSAEPRAPASWAAGPPHLDANHVAVEATLVECAHRICRIALALELHKGVASSARMGQLCCVGQRARRATPAPQQCRTCGRARERAARHSARWGRNCSGRPGGRTRDVSRAGRTTAAAWPTCGCAADRANSSPSSRAVMRLDRLFTYSVRLAMVPWAACGAARSRGSECGSVQRARVTEAQARVHRPTDTQRSTGVGRRRCYVASGRRGSQWRNDQAAYGQTIGAGPRPQGDNTGKRAGSSARDLRAITLSDGQRPDGIPTLFASTPDPTSAAAPAWPCVSASSG